MKMISANKLNRIWKNGVIAKMVAKTKVLKTMEEISANTSEENVAGAVAVKELSNNLSKQPDWIRDKTGKITGYKFGGADTVFPFSSAKAGSFVSAMNEEHVIDLGFEPSFIIVYAITTVKQLRHWTYCKSHSEKNYAYNYAGDDGTRNTNIGNVGSYGGFYSIGSIVKWRNGNSAYYNGITVYWVAVE